MAIGKQIAANRADAKRSTGPKTISFGPQRVPTWLSCRLPPVSPGRRQARTAGRVGPFCAGADCRGGKNGRGNSKPPSEDDRRMRQLPAARNGLIEIDLGNQRRIRVNAHVDPEALARVLDVLERR